jgi:hypothetical protein
MKSVSHWFYYTEVFECLSNYQLLKKDSALLSLLVSGCITTYSYKHKLSVTTP